ncbi:unnamed protein product [Arctogadus glacialis]
MSSLLKEELERVLFRPEEQRLVEFIEIEEPAPGRHFFCVGVSKKLGVQLCIVGCNKTKVAKPAKTETKSSQTKRSSFQDSYKKNEIWALEDLSLIDGRDPDVDDPCFILHFDKVRSVTAINCSAKYALVRALVKLSDKHSKVALNVENMDWAYVRPTSFYSNRGDCAVLSQICFYAFNLVCLSMCPVPLD